MGDSVEKYKLHKNSENAYITIKTYGKRTDITFRNPVTIAQLLPKKHMYSDTHGVGRCENIFLLTLSLQIHL